MEFQSMVNIDFRLIGANIVNFLILVLIIKHFFYDKINNFMQTRTDEIATEITEAETLKAQAEGFKAEYIEKLGAIEDKSREIIKDATLKAEDKKSDIIKSAKEEADKVLDRNKVEIERERQKALEDVKTNIVDLTIFATEKVIKETLDKTKHEKLIFDFIEEVGEVK
ncbi:F0F1 ATP synthase subunit B [Alkalibaculum sp. M08DMB]|uniref:ATP synthase subunit b n=1 Tax=Alkalibaculum sporogenes TaxID=2655001 RepID=A0A6A7KC49_9FIRM|nr:F0F1 ATP synthase subunit B [Alkalibaculum sporogenes]MPW27004.1 F0F1 ATP synthase subunit B [Alkalibaculum sporogenes]